jgi:hypothetical protein
MEKRIAFDIDGVLTRNTFLPKKERTPENYLKLEPIKPVFEVLVKLKEAGFKLYIISSRNITMNHSNFQEWLDKIKLGIKYRDFEELIFVVPAKEKAYLAERLECAVLVDDSMEAINECNNTVVKGMLFIDQSNRRYTAEEYMKYLSTEISVIDASTLGKHLRYYFKEGGIVF